MIRRPKTALSCAVLAFLAVAIACEEPTQITARITTNERCENLSDVQTIVGPNPQVTQERFAQQVPTGVSDRCDPDGFIGTLVITPGGGTGTILVAVGVRGSDGTPPPAPTDCFKDDAGKRCIIARRTFSFIENKPLVLPINLDPLCIGQSCDPASTCFKGSCVSANVICVGDECGLPQENPGGSRTGEGGASEASSSDGAYDADVADAPFEDVFDSGVSVDAMPDAASDADSGFTPVDSGAYPPCSMAGMSFFCQATQSGTKTPGTCADGGQQSTFSCCRCTCPNFVTRACESSAAATFCSIGTNCP